MPSTGSPPPWSRSAPWARGPSPSPTPVCRSGYEQVMRSGAVAEVCGNLFAEDGGAIDSSISRHTLSVTAEQLRKVPRVVMAAAHTDKAAAVRAVCAAGVPTDVVLDVELAHALLRMPAVTETQRSTEREDRTRRSPECA